MSKFTFADELQERERKTFATRLFKLAALLKSIPNKAYNHDDWLKANVGGGCGTSACALGYAAGNPKLFRELGLRWNRQKLAEVKKDGYEDAAIALCDLDGNTTRFIDNALEAERYFGPESFAAIFDGDIFPTPTRSRVIKKIESFVEQRFGYVPA